MNAAAWFYRQSFNGRVAREAQGNGVRRDAVTGLNPPLNETPCVSPAADAAEEIRSRAVDGREVLYGRTHHHLARRDLNGSE